MAGPTTVERGVRQHVPSDPPPSRRRLRLSRFGVIIILAVVLMLVSAGSGWLLYGSKWLHVEAVSVTGTRVLTPGRVRDVADVPLGDPLISVDTAAIEARLRRELPRIDEVDVARSWPREISLEVRERTAVLVVPKGGEFVEVDDDGVRFATVATPPKGVPALEMTLARTSSAAASLRRFGEGRLTREAVRVADAVPAAVSRATLAVKVRSYDDISLKLRDGRIVSWGSGEKGAAKARSLTALMKASPHARHFDVSVPTAPASSGS